MATNDSDYDVRKLADRIMVTLHCKECGEKLRIRGSVSNGKVDTGVKMCFCGNENLEMVETKGNNINI